LLGFSVEAPGIEPGFGHEQITIEQQNGSIGLDADPANVSDRTPKCPIVRRVETPPSEPYDLVGVVETALARALVFAAEAARWDVVMQIAAELQGRRERHASAPAGNGDELRTIQVAESDPLDPAHDGEPLKTRAV
jgi:hypothetical protein